MAQITQLLEQLNSAAGELRSSIYGLDEQIAKLAKERNELSDSRLSKAEYLEFLRRDIARKSEYFTHTLLESLKRSGFDFLTLANCEKRPPVNGTFYGVTIPYLTGVIGFPPQFTEGAAYFYFGDTIVKRIGDLLDSQEWPDNAVPVADRVRRIAEIDLAIQGLKEGRAGLVAQLQVAGLER